MSQIGVKSIYHSPSFWNPPETCHVSFEPACQWLQPQKKLKNQINQKTQMKLCIFRQYAISSPLTWQKLETFHAEIVSWPFGFCFREWESQRDRNNWLLSGHMLKIWCEFWISLHHVQISASDFFCYRGKSLSFSQPEAATECQEFALNTDMCLLCEDPALHMWKFFPRIIKAVPFLWSQFQW